MKTSDFLQQLDEAGVVAAITGAESRTSAEIRVFISKKEVDNVVVRAEKRFEKLGMTRTRQRNAVLLYFAPRSRKFAVVGDTAINEKCGPDFWETVIAEIRPHLQGGRFTEAVICGVGKVGEILTRHFPIKPTDRNELPNNVIVD